MEWISVKESPPEEDEDLILWDGFARIRGYYKSGKYYSPQHIDEVLCTHYVILPEPPKE
jgi:hypothetical protein